MNWETFENNDKRIFLKFNGKEANFFYEEFENLSKNNMEKCLSYFNFLLKKKYPKKNKKLYGMLKKTIKEEEFLKFVNLFDCERIKMILKLQNYLNFRISDSVKINIKEIDFIRNEIIFFCQKLKEWQIKIITPNIRNELLEYVKENKGEIEKSKGYLFFSKNKLQKRDFLSEKYVGKIIRKVRDENNLGIKYATIEVERKGKKYLKNLNILTSTTLRHSSITNFQRKYKNPNLTRIFAGHKDFNTTLTYCHENSEDLKNLIYGNDEKLGNCEKPLEHQPQLLKYL